MTWKIEIWLLPNIIDAFLYVRNLVIISLFEMKPNIIEAYVDAKPYIIGSGVLKLGDNKVDTVP